MPKTSLTSLDAVSKLDRRSVLAGAAVGGLAMPLTAASQGKAASEHAHNGAKHDDLTRTALECVGRGGS